MNQSWNARAHGRKLALGLALSGLTAVIAQGGCASSDTPEFILLPDAGVGTGNSATGGSSTSGSGGSLGSGGSNSSGGSGGSSATGGSFGTGGNRATGGTVGSGGSTGSGGQGVITGSGGSGTGGARATGGSTGSGGARATGGTTGSGGTTATGGMTGSGGTRTTGSGGAMATGGTTGSGGSSGTAPTFTQIYAQILNVSCTGSQCHNPGTQSGVSFSSQSTAYNSLKSRVTAGNATGSSFYTIVNSGRMPPGGKLSSSLLKMIADWINAGAMNN